jgi:hypothetical protein
MASEEQAQEAVRESGLDTMRPADGDRERSNLPGIPVSAGDQPIHRTGNQGPATLFAKVVGIRR